jgi:hypothetical protein
MRVKKEHTKFKLRQLKGKFLLEDLNEFHKKILIKTLHIYCKARRLD